MSYENQVSLSPYVLMKTQLDNCREGDSFHKGKLALLGVKIAAAVAAIATSIFIGIQIATHPTLIAEFSPAARAIIGIALGTAFLVLLEGVRRLTDNSGVFKSKEEILAADALKQAKLAERTLNEELTKGKISGIAVANATVQLNDRKRIHVETGLTLECATSKLKQLTETDDLTQLNIKKARQAFVDAKKRMQLNKA